jgi:colanic acid/amylovoran biosynthesis protein
MIIEVKGGGFVNKGAQLMLQALLTRKNLISDDSIFVMHMMSGSFSDRKSYRLGHLAWLHTWNYLPAANLTETFFSFFPRSIRQKYNIWLKNEIQLVFDISGFIYSDEFGAKPCQRMADYYTKLHQSGAKIILMPQAMGPFSKPIVRKSVLKIIDAAKLIFIRDDVSFDYVTKLVGHLDKIVYAPDFTFFLKGKEKKKYNNFKDKVCIIPNDKLFSSHTIEKNKYIGLLKSIISFCNQRKIRPFFLLHEYNKDNDLLDNLNGEVESSLDIVSESDPLVLKAIIGNSKLIISSRYHGLINALYQSVPVIATGWSHKYEALMNEYSLGDYLISDYQTQLVIQMMNNIFDKSILDSIIKSISLENKRRKNKLDEMWKRIEKIMET